MCKGSSPFRGVGGELGFGRWMKREKQKKWSANSMNVTKAVGRKYVRRALAKWYYISVAMCGVVWGGMYLGQ